MNEPEWSEEDWERDRKARKIMNRKLKWEVFKMKLREDWKISLIILAVVLVVLCVILKDVPW